MFAKSGILKVSEQKNHNNSTTMDHSYLRFEGRRSEKDNKRELSEAIGKLKETKQSLEK